MKDNEIIKTMESCLSDSPPCTACKYDGNTFTVDECMGELMKDALDLINRQKAEIKQKDTEIDILIRKKETLKDELAEKQAEIEELQKYKHDYYVLQSITRKEFAERLTASFEQFDTYDTLHIYEITDRIDNLLEEMESERE
jgi:hypothetical protein